MIEDDSRWRAKVKAARDRGDHFAAFDAAEEGLKACPGSIRLEYAATLALAQSGATRGARARLERLRASGILDTIADRKLRVDFAALDGRLHKDAWQRNQGETARAHAQRSAEVYAAAFDQFDDYYPAINAATMFLAAGNAAEARRFADAALVLARAETADYWVCATAAEASVILGDEASAGAWLERAASFAPAMSDLASTRRQILFAARTIGIDEALIDRLPAAPVRYWLDDGAPPVSRVGDRPASILGMIVFGAVVSPVDVARADALLDAGASLNLVLPCQEAAWLGTLDPATADAVGPILDRVIQGAHVTHVTREGRPNEPAALDLCRRQVRGLALLRAAHLAVTAERLGWPAGVAADPIIHPDTGTGAPPSAEADDGREPHALVFGDVEGFSRLSEANQLRFLEHIIGGFASVLEADRAVEYAETAGDGLYVVLADVESAARCCFGLRDVLDPARVSKAGLPSELRLRLSAHVGPVYRRVDRVIDRTKFCGSEVIRTARIEPVTPPGEIYVTEQFAAALADAAGRDYACDYVGRQPMAKGFGECRMYALRRWHG